MLFLISPATSAIFSASSQSVPGPWDVARNWWSGLYRNNTWLTYLGDGKERSWENSKRNYSLRLSSVLFQNDVAIVEKHPKNKTTIDIAELKLYLWSLLLRSSGAFLFYRQANASTPFLRHFCEKIHKIIWIYIDSRLCEKQAISSNIGAYRELGRYKISIFNIDT